MTDKGFKMIVEPEDWEKMDQKRRDFLMFNTLKSLDCRLQTLERRKLFDRACSFGGGIIGGIIAFFTSELVKR